MMKDPISVLSGELNVGDLILISIWGMVLCIFLGRGEGQSLRYISIGDLARMMDKYNASGKVPKLYTSYIQDATPSHRVCKYDMALVDDDYDIIEWLQYNKAVEMLAILGITKKDKI